MSITESAPKSVFGGLMPPARRGILLLPPLLAVMGMLMALAAATMGQDQRRARDTLKMKYDLAYWENQQAKLRAGEPGTKTPEEIARGLALAREEMNHPPWKYGYAKYGRQFAAWDAYRYEEIVEKGYTYHQPGASTEEQAASSMDMGDPERRVKDVVWFPLYPLLGSAVVKLLHVPAVFALTVVSWTSCLLASVLLFIFARRHFFQMSTEGPRQTVMELEKGTSPGAHDLAALLAVMLLLFGPCSIFLYANFTESLFVLLLAAFLLCVQSRWWWRAAIIAGIASACRSQGVLFGPILALVFLLRASPRSLVQKIGIAAALGIVSSVGLAAYMLFLRERFGDPLAFTHAQIYWNVAVDAHHLLYALNPYHALAFLWQRATAGPMNWPLLWESLCLIWPPVLLVLGRRQLTLELKVLGWAMWALPFVSNSMAGNPAFDSQWMSMGRFMAVLLPAQLIVGQFLARRPRAVPFVLIPSVAGFAVFAYLYGNGAWVG